MELLLSVGIGAGALVVVLVAVVVVIARFRIVPEADEALVVTGTTVKSKDHEGNVVTKPKVVVGGGAFVIPILHKHRMVSLEVVQIPILRNGRDALPSKDRIPVQLEGELTVQVDGRNEDQIILASQKLGLSGPEKRADRESMQEVVKEKADKLVAAALRTVVFEFDFVDLNAKKEEFENRVQQLLQKDLARLGLTLTAVSIPQVTQGVFAQGDGDMFDAQGRKKVAEIVERAKTDTNDIEQTNRIARQRRDLEARERELELEFERKQREADNARHVAEYEAAQRAETRKAVLMQEQAEREAEAAQARAVREAEIAEQKKIEAAEIAKEREIEVQRAEAEAQRRIAEEQAAKQRETAEIERQKSIEAATIEKNKAIEAARIAQEQEISVANERRQQAIEEAEVARQVAVAQKREEEAQARAKQATAEASQREAEEGIETVKARAEAERRKAIVTINAQEEAEKDRIAADRDAYVETRRAEAERDATQKRAEATKAEAEGRADAKKVEAEAYAADLAIRAEAEFAAADKQAQARKKLAEAELEEGRAAAEARRLQVEAENAIARELLLRDVTIKALEVAPSVVHELMAPVSKVTHDVKILQVSGLSGGQDDAPNGLPATILNTGLAAAGITPFLTEATKALRDNPDVKDLTGVLGKAATGALRETVGALRGEPGVKLPTDPKAPSNGAPSEPAHDAADPA